MTDRYLVTTSGGDPVVVTNCPVMAGECADKLRGQVIDREAQ